MLLCHILSLLPAAEVVSFENVIICCIKQVEKIEAYHAEQNFRFKCIGFTGLRGQW